jgi:hypothetical protein
MTMARVLILASTLIASGGLAYAQQASSPSNDAPPKAASVSPSLLKRAKDEGFKPEVRNGVTVYCWKDADIGSRFTTKKCVGEDQLQIMLDRRQAQRDEVAKSTTGGMKAN